MANTCAMLRPKTSHGSSRNCKGTAMNKFDEILENVLAGDLAAERAVCVRGAEAYEGIPALEALPIWQLQTRRLMDKTGNIDPEDIDEYIALGGYSALAKALIEMQPADIIKEIK